MNEHAKAWVAALRSGEFTQSRSALQNTGGFCCLGVACELYRRAHPEGAKWTDSENCYPFSVGDVEHTGILPAPVREWLNLRDPCGAFKGGGYSLMRMNDAGNSFEEIANAIEADWEKLV